MGPERKRRHAGKQGIDPSLSNFKACAFSQFPRETRYRQKIIQCWAMQVIQPVLPDHRGDHCRSERLNNLSKITRHTTVSAVEINKLERDLIVLNYFLIIK